MPTDIKARGPQVFAGAAAILSLLALALNLSCAVSLPGGSSLAPTSAAWYTVSGPALSGSSERTTQSALSLFESCISGGAGSCTPWSAGGVSGRFGNLPTAPSSSPCLVNQSSREFWAAVHGSSSAATLIGLSMACSALLLASACIATNNHCLAARDGAAAQPQCARLTGKHLTAALGSLAFTMNLVGAIVGSAALGALAKWLAGQPLRGAFSVATGAGCTLVGLATAANFGALVLAVLSFYFPAPPGAQQLAEGSSAEGGSGGRAVEEVAPGSMA